LLDAMAASADPVAAMRAFEVAAAVAEEWAQFLRVFLLLRGAESPWPAELELVARWYDPHLQRIYEDAFVRQRDIVQLQQIAATYPSRERFLTELALDPPAATSDEAGAPGRHDDYLILSTIHSAKGQEWKTVHILNVVDGCIPSDMGTGTSEEIEEERRLLYVAMTRAKDHLHLMVPQRFYVHAQAAHGDRHVYASRTRFIPDAITGVFESCAWPQAGDRGERGPEEASDPKPAVDIPSRIRALWG
jgi:DNA helicase-2/ATP-dependent DNA helicase PcrA